MSLRKPYKTSKNMEKRLILRGLFNAMCYLTDQVFPSLEYCLEEREIGSATGLDFLHSNVVVSKSTWGQKCGVRKGIKQKAVKYTAGSIECGGEKLEVQQGWISFIVL
jgi:hypothetical protein